MKRNDVERIYQARDILLQDIINPPSLIELAKQVELNDVFDKPLLYETLRERVYANSSKDFVKSLVQQCLDICMIIV
ncbi:hypothetical protein [Nostoc sp.]|uniref:hypothetical protein n=1 Tax=Nostoc sp. TaxID=1180 RepID=UPI002FFCC641